MRFEDKVYVKTYLNEIKYQNKQKSNKLKRKEWWEF